MKKISDSLRELIGAIVTCLAWIVGIFLLGVSVGMLTGCSPKVVPINNNTHDTIYINKQLWDSIHVHDSIYITHIQKGDTVYLTKYKYKEYWREKEIHDTLYRCKTDTCTVKVTEYRLTKKQEFFGVMGRLFVWLLGGLSLLGIFWILLYKAKINL